ncbi:2-amino-4-hydroxy-6-hydroxymethyldihydropteridine diphosphokinase [bacterium]|jgi:2-amino-4-hydroxy-6-hydroxymethyldihydropteridine diphosphokinase|nr:2-amino-4-hydroxy-6-hydroxymethyldihydropteridine diphosphokinase [bacterium]
MPSSSPTDSSGIYISLGSNLGEPLENLREGARRLQSLVGPSLRLSRPWLTTPVDCPQGSPAFANAALQIVPATPLSPLELLDHCQIIEQDLGRRPKKVTNEARPLDLDIIAFHQETSNTQQLFLPHPRAHERFFVLAPLNDLCPHLVLPGHTKTISEYYKACLTDPSASLVEPFDWKL